METSKKEVNKVLFAVPVVTALVLMAVFALSPTAQDKVYQLLEAPRYHAMVHVTVDRPGVGTIYTYQGHNVLTNNGKNFIEQELGDSASATTEVANALALGNGSTPTATSTSLDSEITDCGLAKATGTYADDGTGQWNITKTYTSTCDNEVVNTTALYTSSTSTMFAGDAFSSSVTLQSGDQITVTWNIQIT